MNNKFNILLAEDEPSSQLLFERFMSIAGHSVTIANNGLEAVNYLKNNSYDLCIFDMQMPVMSGLEAVATYKQQHPESKLPFIMLTANIEKDAIEKCKKAGADIHLAKPITYKVLTETISSTMISHVNAHTEITKPADSIIDITQLTYFDDQEFLDKFIDAFEETSDKLMMDLNNALENNYDTFMNVVHSIKGLSGNIGAHTLREATLQAEVLSNTEYKKESTEHYQKIVNELSKARIELVKFATKE